MISLNMENQRNKNPKGKNNRSLCLVCVSSSGLSFFLSLFFFLNYLWALRAAVGICECPAAGWRQAVVRHANLVASFRLPTSSGLLISFLCFADLWQKS